MPEPESANDGAEHEVQARRAEGEQRQPADGSSSDGHRIDDRRRRTVHGVPRRDEEERERDPRDHCPTHLRARRARDAGSSALGACAGETSDRTIAAWATTQHATAIQKIPSAKRVTMRGEMAGESVAIQS
jgi:hypothetical protein